MSYKTFQEQVSSHIDFLRQNGLDVDELEIGKEFVRCHSADDKECGRGEYAYKTEKNAMDKPGIVGLVTNCRVPSGAKLTHKTYGQDGDCTRSPATSLRPVLSPQKSAKQNEGVAEMCRHIWNTANATGSSEYLKRKGVGAYGLRFKVNEYGNVAVVPARDERGVVQAVQFLNPDGKKRFPTGSKIVGLFHMLRQPINGKPLGIGESYVTAATCMELCDIPIVCAFSSGNLREVAKTIRKLYPESFIVIFADNDRHLEQKGDENIGLKKAQDARDAVGGYVGIAVPDFGDLAPTKDASDWNDLVRIKGREIAKAQIAVGVKIN